MSLPQGLPSDGGTTENCSANSVVSYFSLFYFFIGIKDESFSDNKNRDQGAGDF
jgi:hypothetical protein